MKKSYGMKNLSLVATYAVVSSIACFAQEISDETEYGASAEVAQNYQVQTTAQSGVLLKEAGAYQRKSIAFTNFVISKNKEIPQEWENEFVSILQNPVRMMKRFDFNNIPNSTANKFFALPASLSIEDRMTIAVVPSVLAAVDAEKEIRAVKILSEQQKNSFITDKAKESGITEDDIKAVMNAAYIFAPIYNGYSDTSYREEYYYTNDKGNRVATTRRVYELSLYGGAYWWKIENDGANPPSIKILARIETKGSGRSYPDSTHKYPQGYKYEAFRQAASQGLTGQIRTATLDIADFQYTGQILNKNIRNVVISLGRPEELVVNDIFRFYEQRENASGNVTLKKRGWVMVKKVGEKARGLDSTQSKAQIISGIPHVGAVVREVPLAKSEFEIGFGMTPFRMDDKKQNESQREFDKYYKQLENKWKDEGRSTTGEDFRREVNSLKDKYLYDIQGLKVSKMYGPEIRSRTNLASAAKKESGSQWLFSTFSAKPSFGLSENTARLRFHPDMNKENFNDERIEYELYGLFSLELELALAKRIFIRRLALVPELGFGFNGVWFLGGLEELDKYGEKVEEPTYDITIRKGGTVGLISKMGVEIALAPNFYLGGSIGYNAFTKGGNEWKTEWRDHSENENNKEKYKDGPKVNSGDDLKTSGMTWWTYVSFTPRPRARNLKGEFVIK